MRDLLLIDIKVFFVDNHAAMNKNILRLLVSSFLLVSVGSVAFPAFSAGTSASADTSAAAKLKELERNLRRAETQTDMNIASAELTDYWDAELVKVENDVKATLDDQALKLFEKSMATWREYRLAQSTFSADKFRGGTGMPLAWNMDFIILTKSRIKVLKRDFS